MTHANQGTLVTMNQQQLTNNQNAKKLPEDYLFDIISKHKMLYDDKNCYIALKSGNFFGRFLYSPSQTLKDWLAYEYKILAGKYPSEAILRPFLSTLNFFIRNNGEKGTFYNRFHWSNHKIYIDLGNNDFSTVEISTDGHKIISPSPIYFNRFNPIKEIKIGAEEIDPFSIFDFINIKSDDSKLLTLVWMITSCLPQIEKPMLIITGSAGSGKTTAARLIKSIFDPSEAIDNSPPKNEDDLALVFHEKAIPLIDNVQSLNNTFSDSFCRAVTGISFQKRMLYTNSEMICLSYRRSPIITSITIPSTNDDFLSRAIIVTMKNIDECSKVNLSSIVDRFERVRPNIVFTFIEILKRAMSILPSIKVNYKTRMGDFDTWGCAIAKALLRDPNEFMRARFKTSKSVELILKRYMPTMKAIAEEVTNTFYENKYTPEQLLMTIQKQSSGKDDVPACTNVLGKQMAVLSNYFKYFGIKYQSRLLNGSPIYELSRYSLNEYDFVDILEKVNENVDCNSCSHCFSEDEKIFCNNNYDYGETIGDARQAVYCKNYSFLNKDVEIKDTSNIFDENKCSFSSDDLFI